MSLVQLVNKLAQDPRNRIIKVQWLTSWYGIDVFLGNEGQGGSASIDFLNFKDSTIHIDLGFDGKAPDTFWNISERGASIPKEVFEQKTKYPLGTVVQGFGVCGYDGGDAHNGASYFFKISGDKADGIAEIDKQGFQVLFNGNSNLHTTPGATIYDGAKFTLPWLFFGQDHPVIAQKSADTFSALFRFKGKTISIG